MNGFMSLFSIAQEGLTIGLELALYATGGAIPLVLIVLTINLAFRRWLNAAQVCLLWSIVLVRLLMPFAPASDWSLQNLWTLQNLVFRQVEFPVETDDSLAETQDGPTNPLSSAPQASFAASTPEEIRSPSRTSSETAALFGLLLILAALPWIWAVVGIALLMGTIAYHLRFCRVVRMVPDCQDERICRLWKECSAQAKMRTSLAVKLLDAVEQPALLGFFRPLLLLPIDATQWNDQQLRMVMLHELAHGKRWDVAMNWVLLVVAAVHWWNPLYWLAASRVRSLREQACDAYALAHQEGATRLGYGELLLELAARPQRTSSWKVSVSLVGFFSSYWRKRAISQRIRALRFSAQPGRVVWLIGAALIALVAWTGLTDANDYFDLPDADWHWVTENYDNWSLEIENPKDTSPTITRMYSVEKVLSRISRGGKPDDNALNELKLQLIFTLNAAMWRGASPSPEWAEKQFRVDKTTLALEATERVHAEIAKNLAAWEQSGWGQTSMETKFIRYEGDLAGKLGLSWQSLITVSSESQENDLLESGLAFAQARASMEDYLPVGLTKLNDAQVRALMDRVTGDNQTWVMQAPKITAFNGQKVSCLGSKRHAFPIGAQEGGLEKKMTPTLTHIDEGFRLTFRAVQSADRRKVRLESRVDLNHIEEVRSVSTRVGNEPVHLQIPRMSRRRVAVASDLEDGQSLLIGCFPSREQKAFLYVLLTPRVILDEAIEAAVR